MDFLSERFCTLYKIDLGNDLVLLGNKSLPVDQYLYCHRVSLGPNELTHLP